MEESENSGKNDNVTVLKEIKTNMIFACFQLRGIRPHKTFKELLENYGQVYKNIAK